MTKQNSKKRARGLLKYLGAGILAGAFALGYVLIPEFSSLSYDVKNEVNTVASTTSLPATEEKQSVEYVKHVTTPEAVKGVYMSQCAVGTKSFRESLEKLIDETELNSIVIDIKDYTGKIAFPTDNPLLKDKVSDACGANDMKDYIKHLHEKGIYVIGRITVFQDPYQSKLHPDWAVQSLSTKTPWKDYKGLSFIDVGSRDQWQYIVELAKESYKIGFDEINFDYIRYPSDGNMKDTNFTLTGSTTKAEMLRQFFAYLHSELKDTGAKTSADLFGMTATNIDDLNIGQILENALPYFDYVSPMVYPSHYPPNFNGWADPNKHTYEVIDFSMESAVRRTIATTTPIKLFNSVLLGTSTATTTLGKIYIKSVYSKESYDKNKIRPWLQDFNYGGKYGPTEISNQIRATYNNGLSSWLFWDAGNKYSSLKQVLKSEATSRAN